MLQHENEAIPIIFKEFGNVTVVNFEHIANA